VKRFVILFAALLASFLIASPSFATDLKEQRIRIGAFNFYPGIFQAKDGAILGFYVDVIAEVARREGWQVEYLYGDWAEGISRVKSGEVDMLTSVAWTRERAEFLDYGKVPLLTVWGELYVPRRSQLTSIREVEGKKVAVMKADFNGASFRNMVEKFGLTCQFVEYGNFEEIFQAVSVGLVDAGVVNNTFGAAKQYEYGLASTGIIFNPFDIFLATAKGKNGELLQAMDRYLVAWRASDESPYHKALKRWSHGNAASLPVTPGWLFPALAACAVVWAAGSIFIFLLRKQVRRKTVEAMSHLEALSLKNFTIENLNDAVYWITPEGRIWDVNGAASQMLGYTKEELLSMAIPDIDPDCPPGRWLAHWEELKQKGSLQFEEMHRTRDGRAIPVEITANYSSYNGTEYNCSIVRDITERKRMEQALEHRLAVLTEPVANLSGISVEDLFDLEELQAIQDSFAQATGVASIITDANGRPITRPSNFCALCSEIIRKTDRGLTNCMNSDAALGDTTQFGPSMQPCLSGGLWDGGAAIHVGGHHVGNWLVGQVLDDSCDIERMLAYADEIGADKAAYRQALSTVTRMPREQFEKVCQALFQIAGQLSRMAIHNVQQAQHISERKRSEELLLEYRKVIECSRDLVCVLDREYRYRMANGSFLAYRERTLDQVVGRTAAEVLGEEVFAAIKPRLDACLRGQAVTFEMQSEFPEYGMRSLVVSCNPIADKKGSIRVACVISDQTDKRHLEEQLRQSQKMEAIGHLAGGIAHDFNNILTVIVGYGNFLEMDAALSLQQKEQVEQIIAAAEKGSQLTRGLLTFSRKQIMDPRVLELNALVNQVQKFLLRIIGEDVRLQFTPHHERLNVLADASQLEQILMNLATNARDAMPGGGVLSIETCSQEIDTAYAQSQGYGSPGRYACITVSDTGNGMDRQTRERIFEPFFSTKVVGKGTGLGMSIVYGIVKQHKGFINVYSEPGDGTAFKIYLPLAEDAQGAELQSFAPETPEPGSETILVAEDDASVRTLVESLLTRYGYRVILAVDGNDCVEKYLAHRESISLILMDVIMPGKNGTEAIAEIRGIDPEARVLYSSGYTADFMKNRGVFNEGVDLIMKPVQPLALLKKVREVIDRERR